ncbi:MAG: hypothetical protein B7Z40_06465 [Bosea sp. 12-68-7]|nr:MAG: hypothetical protein B7Z40_06465 [Bosea sp. 12-68-7]OYX31563.1 MAG: hypothetical protein B7Y99_09895 [Caulobacterales bacterium 32-69-10]
MATIRYGIVEHDGGWAYKVQDVLSETYPSHEAALRAASDAAARQTLAGTTDGIVDRDEQGRWHEELADGPNCPVTRVVDEPSA